MTNPKVQPFGLWKSPISQVIVSQHIRFNDVQWDSDGETLVWLEGRSDRGVLVARQGREASRDLTDEHSVRGGIGYGGGEFTVSQGQLIFSDRSGRLFARPLESGRPHALTPPFGAGAAPVLSPDGKSVLYVFSDGREDCLATADITGSQWPVKLTRGADFYMQPAWHPAGNRAAWVEWDHPNMPWDGTRVMMAELGGETTHVGGDGHNLAVQPRFSPDGRWLSYIAASGEWQSLMLVDLQSGQQQALVTGDGFELSAPAWVQGDHAYGWSHDSRRIFYLRYRGGFASLWQVDVNSGQSRQIDTGPYTWISQLAVSPARDELAFLASSAAIPDRVVRWDGGRLLVEARSETESIPLEYLPQPLEISWKAPDGTPVHGLYYAPSNPDFTSPGLPPAIVRIHGGPTSLRPAAYSAETAYYTSRGYGVLEVNYRGSTGYGRSYRDMLRENWGPYDTQDAAGGARAMIEQGLADGRKLVIMGGSAGGFTVLNALIHEPGLFKAGICLFGVSSLFTLAMDTHKFEERYTDSLVGPLPQAAARYREWSPIYHAEHIRDPLAVFQGSEDKVVVPDQSEQIVKALRERGVPHLYKLYQGEGHGFRKIETIADFLQTVERFLLQYVVFAE